MTNVCGDHVVMMLGFCKASLKRHPNLSSTSMSSGTPHAARNSVSVLSVLQARICSSEKNAFYVRCTNYHVNHWLVSIPSLMDAEGDRWWSQARARKRKHGSPWSGAPRWVTASMKYRWMRPVKALTPSSSANVHLNVLTDFVLSFAAHFGSAYEVFSDSPL